MGPDSFKDAYYKSHTTHDDFLRFPTIAIHCNTKTPVNIAGTTVMETDIHPKKKNKFHLPYLPPWAAGTTDATVYHIGDTTERGYGTVVRSLGEF